MNRCACTLGRLQKANRFADGQDTGRYDLGVDAKLMSAGLDQRPHNGWIPRYMVKADIEANGCHDTSGSADLDRKSCLANAKLFADPCLFNKAGIIGFNDDVWPKAPHINDRINGRALQGRD